MKKILVFLFCIICTASVFAQMTNFQMTPEGLVDANDKKSYTIIPTPGLNASQLYNAFLVTLRQKCIINSNQIDGIEGKAINVYDVVGDDIKGWIIKGSTSGNCRYNLLFQFKDESVRVEAPIIVNYDDGARQEFRYLKFWNKLLFNKKGEPRNEDNIFDINNQVNTLLSSIIDTALNFYNW